MILSSNTRLTDRIAEWLGRRLARYLAQPIKDFVPLATADPGAFLRAFPIGRGELLRSVDRRIGSNRGCASCWSSSMSHR
jgi:hypothetical protein